MGLVSRALYVPCILACLLYFFAEPGTRIYIHPKRACGCMRAELHSLVRATLLMHVMWCVCTRARTALTLPYDSFKTVASQGPCELPNLILITSTAPVPVVSLQHPLCFGCIFPMGLENIPIPLGTEWAVIPSGGALILLANNTLEQVTLSGTNGTVLLESPSSLLEFETSQIRCTYTSDTNFVFTITTTLVQTGKSCFRSYFETEMYVSSCVYVKMVCSHSYMQTPCAYSVCKCRGGSAWAPDRREINNSLAVLYIQRLPCSLQNQCIWSILINAYVRENRPGSCRDETVPFTFSIAQCMHGLALLFIHSGIAWDVETFSEIVFAMYRW